MQRIVIVGSGGAGKSTLANKLGQLLSIKVYHLDKVYWRPGWQPLSLAEFSARQKSILKKKRWIIDGNYDGTLDMRLPNADTIIVLDLPTHVCLLQAIKRYLKYRKRTRPDITPGNPERLTFGYMRFIFTYRHMRRPKILKKLDQLDKDKQVFILKSNAQIREFFERVYCS